MIKYILLFIFMMGVWLIDVSVTSLNLGVLSNGLWTITPETSYHLGLYIVIFAFMLLIIIGEWDNGKINKIIGRN